MIYYRSLNAQTREDGDVGTLLFVDVLLLAAGVGELHALRDGVTDGLQEPALADLVGREAVGAALEVVDLFDARHFGLVELVCFGHALVFWSFTFLLSLSPSLSFPLSSLSLFRCVCKINKILITSGDVARPVVLGEVLEEHVLDPRHPGFVLLVVLLPGPLRR